MAQGLNQCNFIGNLGRDPESRTTNNGTKVVSLRLAVGNSWRDKNSGERRERTEWVSVVIWAEGLANVVEQYCKKGDPIFISGELQTRKWQDQQGADRYTTEVVVNTYNGKLVLLRSKPEGGGSGVGRGDDPGGDDQFGHGQPASQTRQSPAKPTGSTLAEDLDDEIPF